MKPIKVVTPVSGDPDVPNQNLLGLGALAAELASEGISVRNWKTSMREFRTGNGSRSIETPGGSQNDRTSASLRGQDSASAITASTAMRW
jgi:hypothetical protein